MVDALQEVPQSLLSVHVLVVGALELHVQDVGLDQLGIVAHTLQEEALEPVLLDLVEYLLPPLPGGVGRVEDAHVAVLSEEAEGVLQRRVRHGRAQSQGVRVIWSEELMVSEIFLYLSVFSVREQA